MGMAAASSQFCFFFTLLSVLTISSSSGANGAVLLPTHQIRVLVWDFRVLSSVTGSGVPVDLYLDESLVENLVHSEDTSVMSWLETHVVTFLPHVDIKTIILGSSGINDGVKSTGENISSEIRYRLEKFHYAMEKINLERRIRLSVAFPLPLLEKMKTTSQERDFHRILDFIKGTDSSVVVESGIENLKLVQSLVENSEFADIEIRKVSFRESSKQENLPSSGRKLLYDLKTTLHDTTVFPTDPNSPTTPTIVTVPSTNPITVAPTNPTTPTTPIPIPESTPVNMPPPANPPPVTVPGAQPVTNPVTTYPPPAGGNVPGVNPQAPPTPPSTGGNVPGVNPQAPPTPPSNNNAPSGGGGGGSWCVAKPGASQTALQSALDYACGGGADCSTIQQGGSCYNPNTLQNHASYAFNSYYQKNPAPTSCDFGGAATLVHNNPSTGSCVFPSSSSSSSTTSPTTPTTPASPTTTPTTPTTPTPTPPTTTTPPTTQTPPTNPTTTPTTPMTPTTNPITSPAPGGSGSVTPPTVLNSSDPSSVFGTGIPPSVSTSTSRSSVLEPFVGFITLWTSVLAGMIILNM